MSPERPEELPEPPASQPRPTSSATRSSATQSGASRQSDAPGGHSGDKQREAVVVVRGETVRDQASTQPKDSAPAGKEKSPRREVSEAKIAKQRGLPVLDDDHDVGVLRDQIVVRDGKADLAFNGTLIASAAPSSAPKGQWKEYRIYETNGGKHVFSRITRSVFAEDRDTHEAEVFDPSPSSMPSQLLKSARDLARSRPLTWMDAAVAFFGYDPLSKTLYRKVSGQFEEHIS